MHAQPEAPPASTPRRASRNLARADAIGRPVGEVMIRRPKTLRLGSTVSELREQFENPHVHVALFVQGDRFIGLVARAEAPTDATGSAPARTYVRRDVPTIGAGADVAEALAVMDGRGERRLVVLGADSVTLVGLVCLDKSGASFCRERPAGSTSEGSRTPQPGQAPVRSSGSASTSRRTRGTAR